MRKNMLRYFILHLFFTVTTFAQADANPNTESTAKLHNLPNQRSTDLVYLQTNKDIYLTQEDVWFKGYVLDAQLFLQSPLSDILFVQLIHDKTNKIVWEEKYEITNSFVDGHVYLQDDLEDGDYSLQAYTSHSFFKDSDEFYALKKIKIQAAIDNNIASDHPKSQEQEKAEDTIQFATFPEGGHLVSGLENKLAFKAINTKGYPVAISGALYENDSLLTIFKSTHAGMGSFIFTPNHNKKYHIKLSGVFNKVQHELPEIKIQGKTMQLISQTRKHAIFKITQSSSFKTEQIALRLQVRGTPYLIASTSLKDASLIKLPLEGIPQGIAEVTLFNEKLEPTAERLLYINLEQQLNIKTTLSKERFNTREKVTLKLEVTNQNQEPVSSHLGLSVFDKYYKSKTDSKNILTHYYLSAHLKGNIYDPAYYFDTKNNNRKSTLDLLLLTQGWRRYVWSETNLKERETQNYSIVSDTLKGSILSSKRKMDDTKFITVTSGKDDSNTTFIEAENNHFKITRDHLKIGTQSYIYLKPIGKHPSEEYEVSIEDNLFDSINKYRPQKTTYYPFKNKPKTEFKEMTPFKFNDQINNLDEVVIKAKKKNVYRNKLLKKLDSLKTQKVMDRLAPPPPCAEIPEINCPIIHPPGEIDCQFFDMMRLELRFPVEIGFDEQLKSMKRNRMAYKQARYSNKKGDLLANFNFTQIKGLYGKREFYHMTYDEFSIDDPMPDARNTLFWKPDIITNDNGEATVEFYCSDTNTEFIVSAEGVGNQGLVGSHNTSFMVDKRTSE